MVLCNRNLLLLVCVVMLLPAVSTAAALNVKAVKSEEKSVVNKVLSAGAMGVTGYGTAQYLQGRAEQSADKDAEQDMRAYLETFRCDYGDGLNIKGGEKSIQLPGGNELTELATEYVKLALLIKARKQALGLEPGIESEEIIDIASGGLYDDVGVARGDGAFASLSRALTDPDGEDAARLNAQRGDSQDKTKAGANMALGGMILGAAGNALVTAAGNGKLKNIFSRSTGQDGQSGALFGDSQNSAVGDVAFQNGGASNGLDAEINRAIAACNTLRSDVSTRADSLYNDILTVQSDATAAELGTADAIETAVTNANAAKTAIADAMSAADAALASAQKLTMPDMPECEAEKPETPNKEDYKNENPEEDGGEYDEDGYKEALGEYKTAQKEYEEALKQCKKDQDAYDKDVKKIVADAKRYADEAERQLNIGHTELNRMQTLLSNAESAKTRGEKDKAAAAEKEAAEKKKEEELQRQIQERVDQVSTVVEGIRKCFGDARNIADQIAGVTLDESEADAEAQIENLKSNATDDIDKAKTATENAEKQVSVATKAGTVKDADAAINEAKRLEQIVQERKRALQETLQKIEDAKSAAKKKYEESQEDSEESEESVEESE